MDASQLEEIPPLGPNEARLYMNNLPWSFTNERLAEWIGAESGVKALDVAIVQNKKMARSKGYGFVKILKSDLERALKLHGKKVEERDIGVQEAKQRTDEERLAFREQKRLAREARGPRAPRASAPAASSSSASSSSPSSSSPSPPPASRPPREKTARAKPVIKHFDNATTLYATNLSFSVTPEQVSEFFARSLGQAPLDVSLPMKNGKTPRAMGYAFVQVGNEKVDAALKLDGAMFLEREIKISLARKGDSEATSQGGDAAASRPPRRRAPRNRGGNAAANSGNAAANGDAAAAPPASSPQAAESSEGGAARPKRNRKPRGPRAGAEEAQQ